MPMSPFAAPAGGMPPQQQAAQMAIDQRTMPGLGEGRNRLAMLLVQAYQELLASGLTPENIDALQQFAAALQAIQGQSAPGAMQGPMPQAQGSMPGGAPPMPPGETPLG